jgi:D-tagatose-1,6-bisphosphate aldolase subunit GatZ/KbaZ
MSHPVDEILYAQKRGEARGIPSICSAHPWVLKTALHGQGPVLIESTCNQVNQFGGYTGMTPLQFTSFIHGLAAENNFPIDRIILGGDHLGPSPWQGESADSAMQLAEEMVQAYVQAGVTKIHLDASMRLGDDAPGSPLDLELAARRTAILARAAESCTAHRADLCYVIGTEVPIPGGATAHDGNLHVTTADDARCTLETTQAAFIKAGLGSAWQRVVALVVQPGVEFGDDFILEYDPIAASGLVRFAASMPLIFEAHSTDYQTRGNLEKLVRDHFAILKVGPALTYAFREAVFALAMIENELIPVSERSNLVEKLDVAMLREPRHWQQHYKGSEQEQAFARKFSLSDRVRYYWPDPQVQDALRRLLDNLNSVVIPFSLIEQSLPRTFSGKRGDQMVDSPARIIHATIKQRLEDYYFACGQPLS